MVSELKQLSSPFSTGGGGQDFENNVQSSFVLLMLINGVYPCLCSSPIDKIELQAKYRNYNTDDIIVYSEQNKKMIVQVKCNLTFCSSDKNFKETIQDAWADFNNTDIFNEKQDKIALITGLLSATDTHDVRNLLVNARAAKDSADFFHRVGLPKFSGGNQRTKVEIFKNALKIANEGVEPSEDQLWRFLKSLHLFIYDLDMQGVALSLLHTLIEQHSPNNANAVWGQIKAYVSSINKTAGFITKGTIPDDIKDYFVQKNIEEIPKEFLNEEAKTQNWAKSKYAHELAISFLIGSWNEKSESDKLAVSNIAQEDYSIWISKIREVLQGEDSPLTLKNGFWSIKNRKEFFNEIKSMIFDADLDCLKETAINIFKEEDPQFELDIDKRYMANILKKVPEHSKQIKEGIAQGLAIIGSNSQDLIHCSNYKVDNMTYNIINEVLKDSSWQIWAGLNGLLPDLCEASPKGFLAVVDEELSKTSCVFEELFNQEGGAGFGGCTYMCGILWALERLAWNEELLADVTLMLGELANIDPGGQWNNRPANSLRSIFLPWFPQTMASVEKRINVVRILNSEFPKVAWNLLKSLIPNTHTTTSGTNKPHYRSYVPADWKVKVTHEDYNKQALYYFDFLIEQSKNSVDKIIDLVDIIGKFPENIFENFISIISSDYVKSVEEDERLELWRELKSLIARHRHFRNSTWSMSEEKLLKIEASAKGIEPKKLVNLYARLFSHKIFEEYEEVYGEEKSDYQEINSKLEDLRQDALEKILQENDSFDSILTLIQKSNDTNLVGVALGKFKGKNFDSEILPNLVTSETKEVRLFVDAYIWSKFNTLGWDWVDSFDFRFWTKDETSKFFGYLPFIAETWEKVAEISKDIQGLEDKYWQSVNVNPYQAESDLPLAIDKLILYKRPSGAIDCINVLLYKNIKVEMSKIIEVLNLAVEFQDIQTRLDLHHVVKLIRALQKSEDDIEDELFSIELKYFSLLDGYHGAKPVVVDKKLQTEPNFFCECIQLIYKSDKQKKDGVDSQVNQTAIDTAWRILYQWKTPPGLKEDGSFSEEEFFKWYEKVVELCTESGHLAVSLSKIGKVLFYVPEDINGFWINKAVAKLLNKKENEAMRGGFSSECINSRGIHAVDLEAKPEKELLEKYKKRADESEKEGLSRLAKIMRDMVEYYGDEIKRISEMSFD